MYKYKSIKQAHHSSPLPQKQNPFCIILYLGGIFWTSFQWTNLKPPTWRPGGPCAGRQGLRGGRRGAGMHAGEGAGAVHGGRPVGGRAGPGCQEPPPLHLQRQQRGRWRAWPPPQPQKFGGLHEKPPPWGGVGPEARRPCSGVGPQP